MRIGSFDMGVGTASGRFLIKMQLTVAFSGYLRYTFLPILKAINYLIFCSNHSLLLVKFINEKY